jgi:hypothetical protein
MSKLYELMTVWGVDNFWGLGDFKLAEGKLGIWMWA